MSSDSHFAVSKAKGSFVGFFSFRRCTICRADHGSKERDARVREGGRGAHLLCHAALLRRQYPSARPHPLPFPPISPRHSCPSWTMRNNEFISDAPPFSPTHPHPPLCLTPPHRSPLSPLLPRHWRLVNGLKRHSIGRCTPSRRGGLTFLGVGKRNSYRPQTSCPLNEHLIQFPDACNTHTEKKKYRSGEGVRLR